MGGIAVKSASAVRISSLAAFVHKNHVDVFPPNILQWAGRSPQQLYRLKINILVKVLADREKQPPKGNVVRHAGKPDDIEESGVKAAGLLDPVPRHHSAVFQIIFVAPRKCGELKPKPVVQLGNPFQYFTASRNDLWVNPVAGDDRNLMNLQIKRPLNYFFVICSLKSGRAALCPRFLKNAAIYCTPGGSLPSIRLRR